MEGFATRSHEAHRIAPRIEIALARKFKSVPREEIAIAVTEGLLAYCEAVRKGTLHGDDNAAGYMWRVGKRTIARFLVHRTREPLITTNEFEIKAEDNATEEFDRKETNDVILSLIENESYREILELHWRKELSFEEISEMQGRSLKAVYNCYERALHRAQEIAWELGVRDNPPPAIRMPEKAKNNLKSFQKWWGKNRGFGIYGVDEFSNLSEREFVDNSLHRHSRRCVRTKNSAPPNSVRTSFTTI